MEEASFSPLHYLAATRLLSFTHSPSTQRQASAFTNTAQTTLPYSTHSRQLLYTADKANTAPQYNRPLRSTAT